MENRLISRAGRLSPSCTRFISACQCGAVLDPTAAAPVEAPPGSVYTGYALGCEEQSAKRSHGTGRGKNVRDHELRGHSMHREKMSQILPRKLFVANHPGLYSRGQCGLQVNEQPDAWFLVPVAGSPLDSIAYGQLGKRLLVGGIGQRVERPLCVDVPQQGLGVRLVHGPHDVRVRNLARKAGGKGFNRGAVSQAVPVGREEGHGCGVNRESNTAFDWFNHSPSGPDDVSKGPHQGGEPAVHTRNKGGRRDLLTLLGPIWQPTVQKCL